jgi:hypothetical protein
MLPGMMPGRLHAHNLKEALGETQSYGIKMKEA